VENGGLNQTERDPLGISNNRYNFFIKMGA